MGDDVGPRKDYINKNANFNKIDAFETQKHEKQKQEDEGEN